MSVKILNEYNLFELPQNKKEYDLNKFKNLNVEYKDSLLIFFLRNLPPVFINFLEKNLFLQT